MSHAGVLRYAEASGIELFWSFDDITKKVWAECYPGEELTPEKAFVVHYHTEETRGDGSYFSERDILRDDPVLVALVKEGDISGGHAKLKIVEVPDGVEWVIEEYDGMEWVAEKHETWS